MSGAGLVLVVDGPGLVGRSTTIAALQRRWTELRDGPLLEVGIDAALAALGPALGRWYELVMPHGRTGPEGRVGVPAWGPMGRELVAGMHRAAAAWARAGFDVAVEHTLLDRGSLVDLEAAACELRVFHVAMVCHPDVLEDRERVAGRPLGQAVAEQAAGAGILQPDLRVDTSETTTDELVDTILAAMTRWL